MTLMPFCHHKCRLCWTMFIYTLQHTHTTWVLFFYHFYGYFFNNLTDQKLSKNSLGLPLQIKHIIFFDYRVTKILLLLNFVNLNVLKCVSIWRASTQFDVPTWSLWVWLHRGTSTTEDDHNREACCQNGKWRCLQEDAPRAGTKRTLFASDEGLSLLLVRLQNDQIIFS